MKKKIVALAVAVMLIGGIAGAAPRPSSAPPAQGEASIPFVGLGSIQDFRPIDDRTLYVQDVHDRWYRATLIGVCPDLLFADTIGFDVRGTRRLDRFSSVLVRGRECPLTSLVESGPPPKRQRHHKG